MYVKDMALCMILFIHQQVKSKSVTAAVEILHEADDVGVDIGVTAYGKSVLDSFTVFCSHSIALLDSLYYALVYI